MISCTNLFTDLKQSSFIILLLCATGLPVIAKPIYAQLSEFKMKASDGKEGVLIGGADYFGFTHHVE